MKELNRGISERFISMLSVLFSIPKSQIMEHLLNPLNGVFRI